MNSSAFSFMDAKIYKEMNNYSNRINNTKLHNIEKTLNKSVEQVRAIEKISKSFGLDSLDDDLKYTAEFGSIVSSIEFSNPFTLTA